MSTRFNVRTALLIVSLCGGVPLHAKAQEQADSGRAFRLVAKLDETDLRWRVDEAGQVRLELLNEASEILELSPPPVELLQNALRDPRRIVPAHMVLSTLVLGPGCGILDEARTQTYFFGVDFTLKPSSSCPGEWQATYVVEGANEPHILFSVGSEELTVESALEAIKRREEQERRANGRHVLLTGRRRDLVERLRNDDVKWHVAGWGVVHASIDVPTVTEAGSDLSIEALIEALTDPDRFIAAHMLLCREYFGAGNCCSRSTSPGFRIAHHGLRVQIVPKIETDRHIKYWKADYPDPEKQQARLVQFWKRLSTVAPKE